MFMGNCGKMLIFTMVLTLISTKLRSLWHTNVRSKNIMKVHYSSQNMFHHAGKNMQNVYKSIQLLTARSAVCGSPVPHRLYNGR